MLGKTSRAIGGLSLNLLQILGFHRTQCFIYANLSHTRKRVPDLPRGDGLLSRTLANVYSKFYSIPLGATDQTAQPLLCLSFPICKIRTMKL